MVFWLVTDRPIPPPSGASSVALTKEEIRRSERGPGGPLGSPEVVVILLIGNFPACSTMVSIEF